MSSAEEPRPEGAELETGAQASTTDPSELAEAQVPDTEQQQTDQPAVTEEAVTSNSDVTEPVEAEAAPVAADEAEADVETKAKPEPAEQAAPPESAQPTELVQPGMDWYVLRVASNKEDMVRDALERKIKIEQLEEHVGRVLVPTLREKRVRDGSARIYHRKLYPGYVFVEMATDSDGRIPENVWFVIKETTGVGDFIGSGGKPSPMPLSDVEAMLAAAVRPEESASLANLAFKVGDRVKVTDGPFENFEGVVDEINQQKGTVRVIVTIFGRPTPIDMEHWQVEQL